MFTEKLTERRKEIFVWDNHLRRHGQGNRFVDRSDKQYFICRPLSLM